MRRRLSYSLAAILLLAICVACGGLGSETDPTPQFGIFEADFQAKGEFGNPYVELDATATVEIPLFWTGEKNWKLRLSPDAVGAWKYRIRSSDAGLDGRTGRYDCVESAGRGGLVASSRFPGHFERQTGEPVWFLGDTAWGYFTDSDENNHHRDQAEQYVRARAAQGFNAIHAMLLSEQGIGNRGGPPFEDIAAQTINPTYWKEVDERVAFANQQGVSVGIAVAWGNKRKVEPWSWGRFPDLKARKRYARYVAARYSAFDVYFLVSEEWHGEIRTRGDVTEEAVFQEFVEIGNMLFAADPHGRMISIHPMTRKGSVREFHSVEWMSFGDYQQNYHDLHHRALMSRRLGGPVVNSEYGYLLRDSDGDGLPDKSNSYSVADMRFASWDIVTAGAYLVTGFGTTYFAGHRDPGPFDLEAAKNDAWEEQIGYIRKFFEALDWARLIPADELIASKDNRKSERVEKVRRGGRRLEELHPPERTYWAMTIPGEVYVIYARGMEKPIELEIDSRAGAFRARRFNPRTGEFIEAGETEIANVYEFRPPDKQDWVLLLERR